jgi:hypothetical protein
MWSKLCHGAFAPVEVTNDEEKRRAKMSTFLHDGLTIWPITASVRPNLNFGEMYHEKDSDVALDYFAFSDVCSSHGSKKQLQFS